MAYTGERDHCSGALRDGDDAHAVPATDDLHRHEFDAVHGALGSVAIRIPEAERVAEAARGEFCMAADPGIVYSGWNLHDGVRGDRGAGAFAFGTGHSRRGSAGVSVTREKHGCEG